MKAEQFQSLIETYGARPQQWPAALRAEAERFVVEHGAAAGPILAEADALDALLALSPTPSPSAELRDRVLAAAATAGLKPRRARRFWLDRLVLASGAGWAAAACAGVVVGVHMTTQLTADVQADAVLYQASLAAVDDMELLQ